MKGADRGNDVRDRVRSKQDKLLRAINAGPQSEGLRLSEDHPGSPTIGELRRYIFPEWEFLVDRVLEDLKTNSPITKKEKKDRGLES